MKDHDKLCAERYGELKGDVRWVIRGIFGLLIGVVAWLAVQLWNGSQTRLAALERPPVQVVQSQTTKAPGA